VDTNIIISYIDEADLNHEKAVKILDSIKENKVTSQLTTLELTAVFSRAKYEKPLSLAIYSLKKARVDIVELDFNEVIKRALKYSSSLSLRTLDLLHVIAASLIKCEHILTFDREIITKSNVLKNILNIAVFQIHNKI
jgi:predicted nucleic acid-binding protein